MKRYTLIAACMTLALTVCAGDLSVGDTAPDFKTVDQDGKTWSLQEQLGDKPIVLYFYPAAMTGGCTKQACSYRDYYRQNDNPAITVVGISGDSPQNLKYFQQAENLNFTLLADQDGAIATAYGVPVKSGDASIKRTVDGEEVELSRSNTASRWTFIVSPEGKVLYKNTQVNAAKDLETILEFLRKDSYGNPE